MCYIIIQKKHIVSLEHRYCNVQNIDINNRGPDKRIISLSLGVDLLASLYVIAIHILIVSLSQTVVIESVNNTEKDRTKKIAQSYSFAPYFAFNYMFPPVRS